MQTAGYHISHLWHGWDLLNLACLSASAPVQKMKGPSGLAVKMGAQGQGGVAAAQQAGSAAHPEPRFPEMVLVGALQQVLGGWHSAGLGGCFPEMVLVGRC